VDELQIWRDTRGAVEPEPEHQPSSIMILFYDVSRTVRLYACAVNKAGVRAG
jgi:hypothetical protein